MGPALAAGCVSVPSGIQPVGNFNINRYLGTWYEIARLDHSFERGLTDVSATYTLRDDGGIDVLNRGFDKRIGKWKQTKGRAYFAGDPVIGHLKVSFFGPFYGSYVVVALDQQDYRYAMVCGPNRSYLWLLSRDQTVDRDVLETLLKQAQDLGFDTGALVFVDYQDHS
jgi:apolipoprotein D and lipocalin family protein